MEATMQTRQPKGYLATLIGGALGALACGILGIGLGALLVAMKAWKPTPAETAEAGWGAGFVEVGWAAAMFALGIAVGVWIGSAIGARIALRTKGYEGATRTAWLMVATLPLTAIVLPAIIPAREAPGFVGWLYAIGVFTASAFLARAVALRFTLARVDTTGRATS